MRDELACTYISPPLPPPVRPSVRVATARSGLDSDLAFPRHFITSGGTHSRRRIKWPTRPVGGPWTYSLPNDIYKKKENRKYGSLCLDAHKFRTPLVLRLCSTPPHHKSALHYLLVLATYYYYGDKDAVCFKSRMYCFSCSAVLLPETYVSYLPSNLFKSSSSTYHAMPPCKEEEGRTTAKLASSILYTLLEL